MSSTASTEVRPGRYHIGISGWTYKPWRQNFYPDGLKAADELPFASRKVNSIEINGTFYRLQTPKSFAHWRDVTPDGFMFSVKASRYLTHVERLKNFEAGLGNFLASGLFALQEKLGPILWQFPPNFKFDPERLIPFFEALPRDTDHAAAIAANCTLDPGRSLLKAATPQVMNHAMEVRHPSFETPEFIDLLRRYGVTLVMADTVKWPYLEDVTGDVIYARLHGSEELYVSGYSDEALDMWADKFRLFARGSEPPNAKRAGANPPTLKPRDVFVYFDNDVKVHAPFNAKSLAQRLREAP